MFLNNKQRKSPFSFYPGSLLYSFMVHCKRINNNCLLTELLPLYFNQNSNYYKVLLGIKKAICLNFFIFMFFIWICNQKYLSFINDFPLIYDFVSYGGVR